MAKEKQKPYEFLSNLVLALMDTDSAFINAFFMDEFAISAKTLEMLIRDSDGTFLIYALAPEVDLVLISHDINGL